MRHKRFKVFLTALYVILLLMPVPASRAEADINSNEILDSQVEADEVLSITSELKKLGDGDISQLLEGYSPDSIIGDLAKGKVKFNIKSILNRLINHLFKEIYINVSLLAKLVILVMLCALLKNLQASFLSESVGQLAFFVCYMVIIAIIAASFSNIAGLALSVINDMVSFMYATLPVLITLLVSGGNVLSGGIVQPALVMIVEVFSTLIKSVFIPLIIFSTIISIVNNISEKIQLSKLAEFLRNICKWSLGLILTIFIAVISVQSSVGAVADGVAGKSLKFAIGAIPVVGGYLSDAADTVLGCTLLIKNAAGVAVMIGILIISLVPVLKIGALAIIFKASAVIIEPVSDKKITACINDISKSVTYIFGLVLTVAIMFIISVTAIIGASNVSTMIR